MPTCRQWAFPGHTGGVAEGQAQRASNCLLEDGALATGAAMGVTRKRSATANSDTRSAGSVPAAGGAAWGSSVAAAGAPRQAARTRRRATAAVMTGRKTPIQCAVERACSRSLRTSAWLRLTPSSWRSMMTRTGAGRSFSSALR